jgi:hypothetical protein
MLIIYMTLHPGHGLLKVKKSAEEEDLAVLHTALFNLFSFKFPK